MRSSIVAMTLALGGAAGCFADPPGVVEGTSTGGNSCPIGSSGCPCTSGGTCDAELECHGPSGRCFDPACDLGSESCPCADGLCLAGLVCVDDYCGPPSSGTSGVADGGTETGSPGTTGVLPMTGELDTADVSITESAELGSISDSTTIADTGPPVCGDCVGIAQNSTCAGPYAACKSDGETCSMHADCFASGQGAATCCEIHGDDPAWAAFAMCVDVSCEGLCGSLGCP